jgi:hypothetical protein
VIVPCASYLLITFDERSITDYNRDYLLFSRDTVGGDDLTSFSGRFGGRTYRINGDRFVWSFFSDPTSTSQVFIPHISAINCSSHFLVLGIPFYYHAISLGRTTTIQS